jgi:hypothetical protein
MISLASDLPGQSTEHIVTTLQTIEGVPEVVTWRPTEILSSTLVDVNTIDALKHSPTALAVQLFVLGKQPLNDSRRIGAELDEILRLKRSGGADDVAGEADI